MELGLPKASWGVATEERGGRTGPVDDYLFDDAVMQPLAGDVADPGAAADAMAQRWAQAPLQNVTRPMTMNQIGQPLMPGQPPSPQGGLLEPWMFGNRGGAV